MTRNIDRTNLAERAVKSVYLLAQLTCIGGDHMPCFSTARAYLWLKAADNSSEIVWLAWQ